MNVLVTGGAGYIGSHTCKLLRASGHTPITLDNLSRGNEWAVKWGPLYKGDIRDLDLVEEIIRKEKIESIIHFAAFAYVGESMQDPTLYYENNLVGTTRFLQAVLQTDVRKLVFSSTCATYGIPATNPIDESFPQQPINPYGYSKLCVERILRDLSLSHGLASVSLRYFNAAGADPDLEIGEHHVPETHLIPLAIAAAETGEALSVFGKDYPTADGTCIRDYIHVCDLAEGHILALNHLQDANKAKAFNLGTGQGSSVLQVAKAVEKAAQRPLNLDFQKRRPGDPSELVASPKLAAQELGWKAKYGLDEILQTAVHWHRKQRE